MNKILFKNSNFQLVLFEHTTLKVFKVFFIFELLFIIPSKILKTLNLF